jgi:solute carrier family 35 protein C2
MPLSYIDDFNKLSSRHSKMSSSRISVRPTSPSSETVNSSKTYEAIVYISGWYFFSLSISIYNKWMFGKGLDFQFPILVTSFHQFCLMVVSSLVLYMKPSLRPTVNEPERPDRKMSFSQYLRIFKIDFFTYMKQIFPCSLASSGDIGLSNVSFRFISLSLYTMLKTSSLTFVLLFGLLFRLEKFNWRLVAIVLVMSGSVVMMVNKPDSQQADESTSTGIILVLFASMASGLRWSFTQLLLKRNSYTTNPISTIFYISPSMCMILFVFGLIFEGWTNFMAANIWEIKGTLQTIVLMIIPGVLAFMMTLCEFKLLTVTQVITLSIGGIFKELLTIILSSVIFGDKLSVINIMGLVLTFVDILWYNYYRYKENKEEYVRVIQEEIEMDYKK